MTKFKSEWEYWNQIDRIAWSSNPKRERLYWLIGSLLSLSILVGSIYLGIQLATQYGWVLWGVVVGAVGGIVALVTISYTNYLIATHPELFIVVIPEVSGLRVNWRGVFFIEGSNEPLWQMVSLGFLHDITPTGDKVLEQMSHYNIDDFSWDSITFSIKNGEPKVKVEGYNGVIY